MKSEYYKEGWAAAEKMKSFKDWCPYSFGKMGCTDREFNVAHRIKMDDWFNGWKANLVSRGLGLNMKKIKIIKAVNDN